MAILLLADHDNSAVSDQTAKALSAALAIGSDVHVLVAGSGAKGAADSAAKADWQVLAGRRVTIWPDNDEAGRRYADAVTAALLALGCTVSIINVTSLGLPPKGDAVDWLAVHPDATAADIAATGARRHAAVARSPTRCRRCRGPAG